MAINPWRDRAKCRDADPNLFVLVVDGSDPQPPKRWGEAVAYCRQCPVRGECFEDGTRNKMDGIWGGKLLSLGMVERRIVIPPKCQSCGLDLPTGRYHHSNKFYCNKSCEAAVRVTA